MRASKEVIGEIIERQENRLFAHWAKYLKTFEYPD